MPSPSNTPDIFLDVDLGPVVKVGGISYERVGLDPTYPDTFAAEVERVCDTCEECEGSSTVSGQGGSGIPEGASSLGAEGVSSLGAGSSDLGSDLLDSLQSSADLASAFSSGLAVSSIGSYIEASAEGSNGASSIFTGPSSSGTGGDQSADSASSTVTGGGQSTEGNQSASSTITGGGGDQSTDGSTIGTSDTPAEPSSTASDGEQASQGSGDVSTIWTYRPCGESSSSPYEETQGTQSASSSAISSVVPTAEPPAPLACPASPWQGTAPWATDPKDGLYDSYVVSFTVRTIVYENGDCTGTVFSDDTQVITGTVTADSISCYWNGTADDTFTALEMGLWTPAQSYTGNAAWFIGWGLGFGPVKETGLGPDGTWDDQQICDGGIFFGDGYLNIYSNLTVTPV